MISKVITIYILQTCPSVVSGHSSTETDISRVFFLLELDKLTVIHLVTSSFSFRCLLHISWIPNNVPLVWFNFTCTLYVSHVPCLIFPRALNPVLPCRPTSMPHQFLICEALLTSLLGAYHSSHLCIFSLLFHLLLAFFFLLAERFFPTKHAFPPNVSGPLMVCMYEMTLLGRVSWCHSRVTTYITSLLQYFLV